MTEAALFRKKDIPDKNIKIDANFNKICFNLSFCCIFSLKTVHIIVAGYKTLKWYFRRKINISKGGDVVG
jgi:hypothetical protein